MAISTYPAGGGGIKSVQRGSAGGSGNVTITAVDITKSFVNIFGTTSSGTVAASGSINAANGNINAANANLATQYLKQATQGYTFQLASATSGNFSNGRFAKIDTTAITGNSTTFAGNSTSLTGGSNNLVAAVVQGYLSNSTTLVVSGACRWEVVEFN